MLQHFVEIEDGKGANLILLALKDLKTLASDQTLRTTMLGAESPCFGHIHRLFACRSLQPDATKIEDFHRVHARKVGRPAGFLSESPTWTSCHLSGIGKGSAHPPKWLADQGSVPQSLPAPVHILAGRLLDPHLLDEDKDKASEVKEWVATSAGEASGLVRYRLFPGVTYTLD